jgi:hypothetical protein
MDFIFELNDALISGKQRILQFKVMAQFDIRFNFKEIRSGLRVGVNFVTHLVKQYLFLGANTDSSITDFQL